METTGRNALCPCGSGKKYKQCCLPKEQNILAGLPHGLRMKGGIRYAPEVNGFVVIVHVWDNVECSGEPQEWRSDKVYDNEEEAMRFYKTQIGPGLKRIMENSIAGRKNAAFLHRQLE
ncbi:MAG: SEC-C metal-binding domain-containing protein [bacterium]